MYTVVSAIQIVRFKDVHGVAVTVIWIIAAIRQERMTLLVAIMMLITGALGLCREHTKLCILYFCSAVHIKKRILKKKKALHDSSVSASVYISVLLHKITNCQSFAVTAILHRHPPVPHTVLYSGKLLSSETWPGPACVLLTPDSRLDPTEPAGSVERGRSAPAGGGRGECRDELDGWCGGRVTLLPH